MALERELCCKDRAADRRRCPLEQSREQRVLERADLVLHANVRLNAAFGVCVLQRFHVGTIMKFEQLFD